MFRVWRESLVGRVVRRGALVAAFLLAAGCVMVPPPRALVNLATKAPPPGADRTAFNAQVYDNVWNWVQARFYDAHFNGTDWERAGDAHRAAAVAAKNDQELYAAINALLAELHDSHTRAQPGPDYERWFHGVNVGLGWRAEPVDGATDGRIRIIEVFPHSPAARANIGVGWTLLACDGQPPLERVGFGKLRRGERVRCEFLDDRGTPRTVTLAAGTVVVPAYHRAWEAAPGVFVFRFDRFDLPSARWLRREMKAHRDARAIILDLRGNTGGHVFALSSVLGDLFPDSVDMGQFIHRGEEAFWHRLIFQWGGTHYRGPLAVLTTKTTASAAEIVAELVREHHRGVLVGQKTRGALVTSVFWPLAGKGVLQLSVYDYVSPGGTRVEHRGVEPDVAIPGPAAWRAPPARDPYVEAALAALGMARPAPQPHGAKVN